ncbi:MAG TPA: hypothetical protein VLG74_12935 [Blastocatellia bacterium]|nr:hypothetical protein [Blastocatellia bacterium]
MKIKTLIMATLVAAFLAAIASIGHAQVIAIKAGKLVDPELTIYAS